MQTLMRVNFVARPINPGRPSCRAIQLRRYWTSPTDIKDTRDAHNFAQSVIVQKHQKVMIPDFAGLGRMDAHHLFDHFDGVFPRKDLQYILASSNSKKHMDYDATAELLASMTGLDSVLVVKGSSIHALSNTPQVDEQYANTIKAVKSSGQTLMLPLRIDLSEKVVLEDIERRMRLGAQGFVTHPIFTDISPHVIKKLMSIVKEYPAFKIRIGALWVTEDLYRRVSFEENKGASSESNPLATKGGLDLYPMRPRPEDGNWEIWNVEILDKTRELLKSLNEFRPQKGLHPIADCTYTRVGMGHEAASVEKIARVIEVDEHELTADHL